ncbi:transcription elongation factor Elf1 [Mucilaginibacter phyllosphaerae]|uniref:Transcription elongation factor Elf1 n=1 Tax=Mucilaginibacter phyllosphaerae TaxID=1812349 RepID=A0ABR6I7K6_9SPHI|nr:transcription elongation factor Elf1 [Mucilaginibacter phyllosphaerae]
METKQKKTCPHCGRGKLANRARRPALMKATLFWLPIKRYSCNVCNKKSYVFGSVWEDEKKNSD